MNAFLDAMFDDLDEVNEVPPANRPLMQNEPIHMNDDEPAMNVNMPEFSTSHNVHIDEQNQGIEDQNIHTRQKVASLAEVNRHGWEASSDEGERAMEAQVAPEVTRDTSGEEQIVHEDENEEPSEDEATMVALIKEKQQSYKAAQRRTRQAVAEADEAFIPSATERYSTVVVQNLVKAQPTTAIPRIEQVDDSVVNYKRFRKVRMSEFGRKVRLFRIETNINVLQTTRPQQHNEMSYIRMLPHDEIQSAMQGKCLN